MRWNYQLQGLCAWNAIHIQTFVSKIVKFASHALRCLLRSWSIEDLAIPQSMQWYTTNPQTMRWGPKHSHCLLGFQNNTNRCTHLLCKLSFGIFWLSLSHSSTLPRPYFNQLLAALFELYDVTGRWLYLLHKLKVEISTPQFVRQNYRFSIWRWEYYLLMQRNFFMLYHFFATVYRARLFSHSNVAHHDHPSNLAFVSRAITSTLIIVP